MSINENVAGTLKKCSEIIEERSGKYGHTWEKIAEIMQILYPDGQNLLSKKDFEESHIFQWAIGKIVRYSTSKSDDCIIDAINYLALLIEINKSRNDLCEDGHEN